MNRRLMQCLTLTILLPATPAAAATAEVSTQAANSQPKPDDAFVDVHDFVFGDGESLASLKLHYLTLGKPRRDASGAITNAVLLLHGTAGSAADLVWLWGEMFPNDMDCLVALASTPAAISGRNMIWREMVSQAIRDDPSWKNGNYPKDSPPKNWINAVIPLSAIMTGSAEQLQKQGPTRKAAIAFVENLEVSGKTYDANDMLYSFESSADYDPAPNLHVINKPMLTINFADDLTNPPEFLNLPTASNYTAVMIPAGPDSYGHMNIAHPAVWAPALGSFLQRLPLER
jgi:homoserine acetyltransferase